VRLREGEDPSRETSFWELLLYVLGFLGAIALLAFAAVWMIRTF